MFEILPPQDPRWMDVVRRLPPRLLDLHVLPHYAAVQARLDAVPRLAVFTWHGEHIVEPFVIRCHTDERIETPMVSSLASPYGYGGPVCTLGWSPGSHYAWYERELTTWARDAGYVCQFGRLNPMLGRHQECLMYSGAVRLVPSKEVVVVNLQRWNGDTTRKDRRVRMAKLTREGWTAMRVAPTEENISVFFDLYQATMDRCDAGAAFRFDRDYIADHFYYMGTQADLYLVGRAGEVEGAAISLRAGSTIWYHLAASRRTPGTWGTSDLLIHAIAARGMECGCTALHLGGGPTADPDDGVLKYKSEFSTQRRLVNQFFRVFDQAAYDDLCSAKVVAEVAEHGRTSDSTFLPAYARPMQ